MKRLLTAFSLGMALLCAAAAPALAAPVVDGVFPVKGVGGNNKIVAGPDGDMWVTVGPTNDVARITPTGEVQEFELGGVTGASGIAVGPGDKLWITYEGGVATFDPGDPKGTSKAFPMPQVKTFHSIVSGPDGRMWVATEGEVLRFDPSTPEAPEGKKIAEFSPRDIGVAGALVVIADFATPRVVTFTSSFEEKDFTIPGSSQGVAGGPGGQIAFSAPGATPEQVGLISPPNPAQSSELLEDPFGVALGSDQAYWFAQFAAGGVVRMTTNGVKTPIGGLSKNSPRQIASGPNNTMWVTLEKNEEEGVARISGLEPPVEPISARVPQTKIKLGPKGKVKTTGKRARVKFRFTSSAQGATFQCSLVKLRKGKKPPRAVFKNCKSPRTYSLKPGRYRFKVRAVVSGQVDPTPASRTFRVVHVAKHKPKPKR